MLTARIWILRAASLLFSLLPLRNKVVFASTHARSLGGNMKCIYDELVARDCNVRLVFLDGDRGVGFGGKLKTLWKGVLGEYHIATARVFIVDDYYFPLYVASPKPQTAIIQTWHACGAFKKVGYSVLDKSFGASDELVRRVRIHSNYTACLVASHNAVPAYSEAFGQPAERFVPEVGIPRTDIFFDEARKAAAEGAVRQRYELPEDKRVILYAPTFRGDSRHEAAYHDDLDLGLLADRLRDDYVLLLRLHPFVASQAAIPSAARGFAIDASDYPDINDLMLVSDVLLTDYSSAIYEFSLLERPMVFFAPDYEAYEAERGFYFDYATGVPGPLFTTSAQVADFLAAGDFDMERVRAFRAESFDAADGHSSARVVDQLVLPKLPGACR